MNYTKGEWKASGFYVSVNNRPIIEMVIGGKEGNSVPSMPITELQANLELCAAAPEMYEALKVARHEIERLAMVTGYEGEAHFPRLAQIDKALAKADLILSPK